PGALATLTNHGTISGGSGSGGALGAGVLVRNGGGQIVNTDTIEGGNGAAAAITTNSATTALNIVNSGTIRAGPGATEAIGWASGVTPTTGSINLELQAGSVIEGNVVGNPTATTDTLRLGGNADSIFDVSTIGAQYQNFDVFEKTGTSTWALTGAGAATTNWTIEQGTLQLGNGGASGSIIGNVTDNGTLAFDRADTMTFSGVISGAGGVSQIGAGTTILTATNAYTGGTAINGGALQVSSDANLGAAAGPLSFDGGTLATTASFSTARATTLNAGGGAFDVAPSTTFSVTGAIGGPGALTKTDAGTLILTANNSYSGGTTIGAGTLQLGNGGTSGGITGDVTDNGALAFNRSDSATFSGAISGGGAVAQIGTGTTILTGDNSYTGRTTISAGTLQLGNGGTSGSIVGNIVDNGALVFNRSDRATLGGVVSGSGTVAQIGPGTTVLTGANTYTGGTTISAGTLQLGNGGATGSILGDVANSGTLAFDRGDTTTFAGVISGAGGVAQIGSGETILNAANPYRGGTIVSAGTLAIGDFAHPSAVLAGGGLITVQSGGTLGGYGSVAGSVINFLLLLASIGPWFHVCSSMGGTSLTTRRGIGTGTARISAFV
ncbi:MAG: autotransporter-associated beta strand repeat-containing protein, partial [Hyphomicrobiales bacterium]|nr:autotransporter-associated beta strand repeat-containing protein [Hyphomicrobiales bacterium]MBV9910837.1 autotransporter-associated beta strand repeat-containing protein [Hyphomicrobiales bacterium]